MDLANKITGEEVASTDLLAGAINNFIDKNNKILAKTATQDEVDKLKSNAIIFGKEIEIKLSEKDAEIEKLKKDSGDQLVIIKSQGESITTLKTAFDPKSKKETFKDAVLKALTGDKDHPAAFEQIASKKQSNASFTIELKDVTMGGFSGGAAYQAGAATQAYMPFQLPVYTPEEDFDVRTAVPTGTSESTKLEFPVEKAWTDAMGALAENADSLESTATFDMSTINAIRISTHIKVSRTALKNVAWLANHISTRLMGKFVKYLNTQVITGPGTTVYLKGLDEYATTFTAGGLAGTMPHANLIDVLLAARARNYEVNKIRPNVAFINPIDAVVMTSLKATTGEWANKEPFMTISPAGIVSVMGMAIVESFDVAVGTYMLVNVSSQNMELLFCGPIEILSTDSDATDFLKNLVTIKLEADVMFPVYREGAIIKGTLAADLALLTGGI